MKFNLGDRVKVNYDNKGLTVEKAGEVTAIYNSEKTPNNYSKCDYRVRLDNDRDIYCNDDDVVRVRSIKAYAYHDKKNGNYVWVSDLKNNLSKKFFIRTSELDIEKEILG